MKKAILVTILFMALTTSSAVAQSGCGNISPGLIIINHRIGLLYGSNFTASISCTRGTPAVIRWGGGYMCPGRYFYGRTNTGRSFQCLVRSIRGR